MTADYRLPNPRAVDPDELQAAYWAARQKGRGYSSIGEALGPMVKTMLSRSLDACAPALHRFADMVKSKSALMPEGKVVRPVKLADPWKIGFAAHDEGSDEGLFVVVEIDKVKTQEALEASRARAAAVPEADRRSFIAFEVLAELRGKGAVDRIDDYETPRVGHPIDNVMIATYGKREGDYVHDGLKVSIAAVNEGRYVSGKLVDYRVSPTHIENWDFHENDPRHGPAVESVEALSQVVRYLELNGLGHQIVEQGRVVADRTYLNFTSGPTRHLSALAAFDVWIDGGTCGPHCMETLWHIWADAAAADIMQTSTMIAESVALLEANGHISKDVEFTYNDLDDHAHFARNARQPDFGTLWVRGQHGSYAMQLHIAPEGIDIVTMARVPDDLYGMTLAADPESPGFLGAFSKARQGHQCAENLSVTKMGRFTDRTVMDINNILLTIESLHCCLEDEYREQPRP